MVGEFFRYKEFRIDISVYSNHRRIPSPTPVPNCHLPVSLKSARYFYRILTKSHY